MTSIHCAAIRLTAPKKSPEGQLAVGAGLLHLCTQDSRQQQVPCTVVPNLLMHCILN
jgi:hypothetical protein